MRLRWTSISAEWYFEPTKDRCPNGYPWYTVSKCNFDPVLGWISSGLGNKVGILINYSASSFRIPRLSLSADKLTGKTERPGFSEFSCLGWRSQLRPALQVPSRTDRSCQEWTTNPLFRDPFYGTRVLQFHPDSSLDGWWSEIPVLHYSCQLTLISLLYSAYM